MADLEAAADSEPSSSVQPGLQEYRRGDLVDHLAAFGGSQVLFHEGPLRGDRGESLVVQHDGDTNNCFEEACFVASALRGPSLTSVEGQRQPDHHDLGFHFGDDTGDPTVISVTVTGSVNDLVRSGEFSIAVGDRDADPF